MWSLLTVRACFQSEPMNKKTPRPVSQQLTHTLFISVRNFECKMADDAELLMTLYDGKDNKSFTENYVVQWSRAKEVEQLFNRRALFTVSYNCISNVL